MRWVLLRAFGPVDSPAPGALAPARLLATARAFDLSSRIAARSGADRLRWEIGSEADGFLSDSRRGADDAVVHGLVAQDVAVAARELSIPLLYLKFQALTAAGYVGGALRGTSDVDVLVPEREAARMRRELLRRGFRPSGSPEYEHQTSAVVHPFGVSVDLHRKLLGVRVAGSRSADALDLIEHGLCASLPGVPGEPLAPSRTVLIAHALVHGIAQHGLAPHSYPLLRMVADLVDLDLPGSIEGSFSGTASWADWIARDVSASEVAAVSRLCGLLASGERPEQGRPEEKSFLAHVIASAEDPAYSRSLAISRWLREPTDHSRPGKLARSLLHALAPPQSELAAQPGRRASLLRRVGIRFARPWVLLGRALR